MRSRHSDDHIKENQTRKGGGHPIGSHMHMYFMQTVPRLVYAFLYTVSLSP